MIKHALFFAAAILLTAFLLRDDGDAGWYITTILVPLWLVTSPMMNKRRNKDEGMDC